VVSNKISECRLARKISKADLARRIGRSRAYVTRVEQGQLQPGGEAMLRIARYFKLPVEEIFHLDEGAAKTISRPCSASDRNQLNAENKGKLAK